MRKYYYTLILRKEADRDFTIHTMEMPILLGIGAQFEYEPLGRFYVASIKFNQAANEVRMLCEMVVKRCYLHEQLDNQPDQIMIKNLLV